MANISVNSGGIQMRMKKRITILAACRYGGLPAWQRMQRHRRKKTDFGCGCGNYGAECISAGRL